MGVDEDAAEAARPDLDDRVAAGRERGGDDEGPDRERSRAHEEPLEVRRRGGRAVRVVHLVSPSFLVSATLRSVSEISKRYVVLYNSQ